MTRVSIRPGSILLLVVALAVALFAGSCVTLVDDPHPNASAPVPGASPLRCVAGASPLIVRGVVEEHGKVPYTYLGPNGQITVTRLRILETLEGDADDELVEIRGLTPPRFDTSGRIEVGAPYVVFLQPSDLKGWTGYEPVGGFDGVKGGTPESCATWCAALRGLREAEQGADAATRRERTAAWLIGLIDDAETRWDGSADLLANAEDFGQRDRWATDALATLSREQWRGLLAVVDRLPDEEPPARADDPRTAADVMMYWRRAEPLLELIALEAGRPDHSRVVAACYVSASRCFGTSATEPETSEARRRLIDDFLAAVGDVGP